MKRLIIGCLLFGVEFFVAGSVFATMRSGGLTLEEISEAPWIFLGEVQSVETIADGVTPANIFPRWQARYTRFKVIHGIKGPFYKGYEVELKECADRSLPGQPFCGSLYPAAPVSKVGERFLIVTGAGNPNVYNYQTSIRFPAEQAPILRPRLPLPGSAPLELDQIPGFPDSEFDHTSESGWLIDLSRLSQRSKMGTPPADPSSPMGLKQKGAFPSSESPEEELTLKRGWADLNKLIHKLGGNPVE